MIPIEGQPIRTAAETREAEARAVAAGTPFAVQMERAGAGIADVVRRLAAGGEALILCGPGNNGGDGYVAARTLAANGHPVRVAASEEPRGELAAAARAAWSGAVEPIPQPMMIDRGSAPVLVDAVFGTGLNRPADPHLLMAIAGLAGHARLSIAVDLPSGVMADLDEVPSRFHVAAFDVTLALGTLKPAHLLQPSAERCGSVRLLDTGPRLRGAGRFHPSFDPLTAMRRPVLRPPLPSSHKYSRGMVAVVAGRMHGAAELAAVAAHHAGAGYVLLLTGGLPQPPHAIVRRAWAAEALSDERIGAVVIGPGLGRDDRAREKLAAALATDRPLVIDGDALHLLDLDTVGTRAAATILTPHAGEFAALFGEEPGNKIERTREAARRAGAVVVHKGADTVVAREDGWATVSTHVVPSLATAGTGDVLAGAVAAMLAQTPRDPFGAASAGVWLHAEAAARLARPFIADELAAALPAAVTAATVAAR